MEQTDSLQRLTAGRSAHLATVRPDGAPHVVVVTFAVAGEHIFSSVDHKPKTTTRLQRLINIESNSSVSLLVDHYDDDWAHLWWVRVDGHATVHPSGKTRARGIEELAAKYGQYREHPPEGPVIAIEIDRVSGWESTP